MPSTATRALTGLATITAAVAVVAGAIGQFHGSFTKSTPITVLSPRAGLVMNPDAKVEMLGVQVGKVESIESRPNGQAVLHLAMHPAELHLIPANVLVDITAPTIFGAKFVNLLPPQHPSPQPLHTGQVLDSQHVTVEAGTIFQRLTTVLNKIDPAKLNETFGALAQALSGRGRTLGQTFSDLDAFLAKFEPSLQALSHDLSVLPAVANAYAYAAPDLLKTLQNTVTTGKTLIDQQDNLDALLMSAIGLAGTGNDVLSTNRVPLENVLRLLVPTTDLTNKYNKALWCGLAGIGQTTQNPPLPEPSVAISTTLTWGAERYRYPTNLPKVAATGGPQCLNLPLLPFNTSAKLLVTDIGANPQQYGNPQLLFNFDVLKQLLYGPIAGPPRNSAQIGQPG